MNASARTLLPVIASIIQLSAVAPVAAASYVVDEIALGAPVPVGSPKYQQYSCRPSDDFADLTWCQRSQQITNKGRNVTVSNTIAHAPDGIAIYLMADAAPVLLSRTQILAEIEQLSRRIGQQPTRVEWLPDPKSKGTAVSIVATWGLIRLEELGGDALETVADGNSPKLGVLVGSLPNLKSSARDGTVYRIAAGPGFVFTASFDEKGIGHRHEVAINALQLTERQLQAVVQRDQNRPSNDYGLWAEVAAITRRLALDSSPRTANEAVDRVFNKFPSKKLGSHVWSLIPGGTIQHMGMRQYGTIDIYGPETQHPQIRRAIQRFVADRPREPLIEFLYYVIGDFDKALHVNPNSPISDILHYAYGHTLLELLLEDAMEVVKTDPQARQPEGVGAIIRFLNQHPERYDHKLLGTIVPDFVGRAAAMQPHFEFVLSDTSSPHVDDAAYMLGWLAYHQGKAKEALAYFSKAISLGNGDYKRPAAMMQTVRILAQYPVRDQMTIIESDPVFAQQPALWYAAARAAYRDHDYALAIGTAERALKRMDVPIERLPVTTDPKQIKAALARINPKLPDDLNMSEIPYIIGASREILEYQTYLRSVAARAPEYFAKSTRTIVIKYSMLLDEKEQPSGGRLSDVVHKDLRQAVHLIDMTLAATPKTTQYAQLREWLHYRKVRILAVFEPERVAEAVAAMEREAPTSPLLDDVLAEQIYAEGIMLQDLTAARATFRKLLDTYPQGNAVDNAYTWMAIILRCSRQVAEAETMNREIIRQFPRTRHRLYAEQRMRRPYGCGIKDFRNQ